MVLDYDYRPDGRLQRELHWDSSASGIRTREKILTYFENDTLVKHAEMKDPTGGGYNILYQYNDKKLLVREEHRDTDVFRLQEFEYDDKRRVVEQRNWDIQFGNSKVVYTYNDAGEVTSAISYGNDGGIAQQNRWAYQDDTLLMELLFLDANDSIVRRWTYDYDEDGKKLREKEVQPDGTIFILKRWEYDSLGNATLEESNRYRLYLRNYRYSPEGKLKEEVEYDNTGRLTFRTYYE